MIIPIEKLKRVSVVYTHGKCPDGLASAMILKHAFRMLGMAPRIEFLVHDTPEHPAAGAQIDSAQPGREPWSLFCDIAPHPDAVSRAKGNGCIVLDHHVGTRGIVESFGENGVYADAEKEPGVSGAVLAFREVWLQAYYFASREEGAIVPKRWLSLVRDFAEYVGVLDTWQTKDKRFTRAQWISRALMAKPASYWLDDTGARIDGTSPNVRAFNPWLRGAEIETGRALFEAHEEAVRQAVEQCVRSDVSLMNGTITYGGMSLLFVFQEQTCGARLTSDVAEALRDVPCYRGVVAGFSYVVDKSGDAPRLVYSLRSLGEFDVQKFAAANGGNGHKRAAGFSVPLSTFLDQVGMDPYTYIRARLEVHLTEK